jgi:uncharacterized protein with ATP-grasp and redox domains
LEDSFADIFSELLALLDAESMLFIDDNVGEIFVDDIFLYEGLCSDDHGEFTTLERCLD